MALSLRTAVAAAVLAGATLSAQAAFIDINLAGYSTYGDFGDPSNSQVFLNIGANATVTGYDYNNLSFTTFNGSYLSEFVLSVNDQTGSEYLDWAVSETDASGSLTVSGSWGGATGFGAGESFSVGASGVMWVTVYELFDDPGIDATVSAGSLRVYYTPAAVPEPTTYALMGLGLLGIGAAARRRSAS